MKMVTKLPLLAVAVLFTACNEKVSPELQSSNSTTSPTPTTPADTTYTFKLTNKAEANYNFHLHKTGVNNRISDCAISSTNVKFDRDLFTSANASGNSTYDITCYLEAEELSLYMGGLKLNIEASPNACDYISYSPFSYYNRQPGDSSGSYTSVTCADDVDMTGVAGALTAAGPAADFASSTTPTSCNEWVSRTLPQATRQKFTIDEDKDLCRFNYTDGDEEQCDIGVIAIKQYNVSTTSVTSGGTTTLVTTAKLTTRTVDCGGKAYNCIQGPIKSHSVLSKFPRGYIYSTATKDAALSVDYTYKPLIDSDRSGTYVYANYRRDLANAGINYVNRMDAGYATSFLSQSLFDPLFIEGYARALAYDPATATYTTSPLSSSTLLNGSSYLESTYFTAKPLAAEAFVGSSYSYYTNPFYTFECLDNAHEIKARIRLMVRDWDRIFPVDTDGKPTNRVELLSDVYKLLSTPSDSPRMDVGYLMFFDPTRVEDEPNGGRGDWDYYNDYPDWDDLISLQVSTGPLVFRPYTNMLGTSIQYYDKTAFPNEVINK